MNIIIRIALSLIALIAAPVQANIDYLGVVAVVGETPISSLDVSDRTNLIIRSNGIKEAPGVYKKIKAKALKQLVDEKLQAEEAKKRGIAVTGEELAAAISGLEKQNRQPPGSLQQFMARKGVSWQSFSSQLRAQLLWNKMLLKVVKSNVRISEEEFTRAAKNKRLIESGKEYNITPLVLTIDSPEKEGKLFALANKIVGDVRQGTSLESIMQKIMKVPAGKEPRFWVSKKQLEPVLATPLEASSIGDVIGPIRSSRGIHIMRVNEVREKSSVKVIDPSQIIMKEILLGLENDASQKEVELTLNIAKQVAQNPGTCLSSNIAGVTEFADTDIKVSFLESTMSELPSYARQQANDLSVGEVGEPFATPQGIRFYILCEKVEIPVQVTADEKLREKLFREKLDLESSKFMRELRRKSFIEIRS